MCRNVCVCVKVSQVLLRCCLLYYNTQNYINTKRNYHLSIQEKVYSCTHRTEQFGGKFIIFIGYFKYILLYIIKYKCEFYISGIKQHASLYMGLANTHTEMHKGRHSCIHTHTHIHTHIHTHCLGAQNYRRPEFCSFLKVGKPLEHCQHNKATSLAAD